MGRDPVLTRSEAMRSADSVRSPSAYTHPELAIRDSCPLRGHHRETQWNTLQCISCNGSPHPVPPRDCPVGCYQLASAPTSPGMTSSTGARDTSTCPPPDRLIPLHDCRPHDWSPGYHLLRAPQPWALCQSPGYHPPEHPDRNTAACALFCRLPLVSHTVSSLCILYDYRAR